MCCAIHCFYLMSLRNNTLTLDASASLICGVLGHCILISMYEIIQVISCQVLRVKLFRQVDRPTLTNVSWSYFENLPMLSPITCNGFFSSNKQCVVSDLLRGVCFCQFLCSKCAHLNLSVGSFALDVANVLNGFTLLMKPRPSNDQERDIITNHFSHCYFQVTWQRWFLSSASTEISLYVVYPRE